MNVQKLKGRIVEKCGSQKVLAEMLGISDTAVNYKLNGRIGFSIEDIANWCIALEIPKEEIADYFFADLL